MVPVSRWSRLAWESRPDAGTVGFSALFRLVRFGGSCNADARPPAGGRNQRSSRGGRVRRVLVATAATATGLLVDHLARRGERIP